MQLFSLKIYIDYENISQENVNNIRNYLCSDLVNKINSENEDKQLECMSKDNYRIIMVTSEYIDILTQYSLYLKKYLENEKVIFTIGVFLSRSIKMKQEDEKDALDCIANIVEINAHNTCYIMEVNYCYTIEDMLCGVFIKAERLRVLKIALNIDLDTEDQFNKVEATFQILIKEYEKLLDKINVKGDI